MTIEDQQSTNTPRGHAESVGDRGSVTKPDVKQMASTAKDESAAVAGTAVEGGREVAGEIADQASAVAGTAKDQLSNLMSQAKDEIRTQGEARGQQLVTGLQTLSDQLTALVHGRPDEAGGVGNAVREAQQRVQGYVRSVQDRGPQGLVDDVTAFARRRPGVFLLAASFTGFAAGRLVRSGAAVASDDSDGPDVSAGRLASPSASSRVRSTSEQNPGGEDGLLPPTGADLRVVRP